MSAVFAPAMEWGGGVEGVAILSRRPAEDPWIEEHPGASTALRRVALAVRVEDAGGPVRIATSHLHYRLEDGAIREAQTVALDALLARRQEPAAVLLGDLNAVPDADEIRFLRGRTTIAGRRTYWQDAWELWHPGETGHTWARENHFTDALHFLQPGRRIDYVLVSPEQPDGRCRVDGAFVAMDRADARGHFPSDHYAVVADVRIGPSA